MTGNEWRLLGVNGNLLERKVTRDWEKVAALGNE